MKKLLLSMLALVGMQIYADEITVHNMTGNPVNIVTAWWNAKIGEPSLTLNADSLQAVSTEEPAKFERPAAQEEKKAWLLAAYSGKEFEKLRETSETNLKLFPALRPVANIKLKNNVKKIGIEIESGNEFYIVRDPDSEDSVRIQKKSPIKEAPRVEVVAAAPEVPVMQEVAVVKEEKKEGVGEMFARKGREIKDAWARAKETVAEAVTTRIEETRGFQPAQVESKGIQNPVLIINGFDKPIYVRMYTKSDVGLIAINDQSLPVKIEKDKYSFLQGPEKGSFFRRSPQATLLVAHEPIDTLKRSTIREATLEDITPHTVYHNEILNIASSGVERFTMGNVITVKVYALTRPDYLPNAAVYVKEKNTENYIQASPIIKTKTPQGTALEAEITILEPNEEGFFARLGFGREKFVVGMVNESQFKARLKEPLPFTPETKSLINGTLFSYRNCVTWKQDGILWLKSQSYYDDRIQEETWLTRFAARVARVLVRRVAK
jgi:hypothetical protein